MGVKSTIYLTRDEAIEKYIELRSKELMQLIRLKVNSLPNKVLEDRLELLNDKVSSGEGFENYIIKE